MWPKYPDITVNLTEEEGNSYRIIAQTRRALRLGGVASKEIEDYTKEATSGDFDNVLQTTMKWVETT